MNSKAKRRAKILAPYEHWHQFKGKPRETIPVPPNLEGFPLWNGYVVHYTVFVREDGTPDFRVAHERHRMACINRGLCGLCGKPLERLAVFIGGERSIQNRYFVDPAMHATCAYFAAVTCPFLALDKRHLAPTHKIAESLKGEGAALTITTQSEQRRPGKMGLMFCRGFVSEKADGAVVIRATGVEAIDWKIMPESS